VRQHLYPVCALSWVLARECTTLLRVMSERAWVSCAGVRCEIHAEGEREGERNTWGTDASVVDS